MKSLNRSIAQFSSEYFVNNILIEIDQEISQRQVRRSECKVVEVAQKSKNSFVPDGSVMAIIGLKGNNSLKRIEDAVRTDDLRSITDVQSEFKANGQKWKELIDRINQKETIFSSKERKVPNIAEIRYDEKTLVNYITVTNELPLSLQLFPYNGGTLEADRFGLIEYFDNNSNEELECVLLVNKPGFSEIEESALRLMPPTSSSLNIGTSVVAVLPVAAALWVAEAAGAAVVGFVVTKGVEAAWDWAFGVQARFKLGLVENDQTTELLNKLPPEASAKELLQLRRRILELQIG